MRIKRFNKSKTNQTSSNFFKNYTTYGWYCSNKIWSIFKIFIYSRIFLNFALNILIPIYQQQESLSIYPTHSDMCPSQVNIIHKRNYNKIPLEPNVEWIKLDYSPYNDSRRAYFKHFLLNLEML